MNSKVRHQVAPANDNGADDSSNAAAAAASKRQNAPPNANNSNNNNKKEKKKKQIKLPSSSPSAQESKLSPSTGRRTSPKGTEFGTTLDAKVCTSLHAICRVFCVHSMLPDHFGDDVTSQNNFLVQPLMHFLVRWLVRSFIHSFIRPFAHSLARSGHDSDGLEQSGNAHESSPAREKAERAELGTRTERGSRRILVLRHQSDWQLPAQLGSGHGRCSSALVASA